MFLKHLFSAFALTLLFTYSYAQNSISGTVIESNSGQSLPGVTVQIKGTTNGTITDINGKFRLDASPSDTLEVSFIGMQTRLVPVGSQTEFIIELVEDVQELNEVVVVGFGTSSKKLLSGSVTKVDAEDLKVGANAGLDQALQAKAAGVQVVQNSGTPGAAISVQVRGTNSISGGTQPLYVIDGVPITTGDFGQVGFEGQGINALADINPDDIESISILKDASAAAIYGARAGNGVVLITTKSGNKGKTRFSLDTYYGIQSVRKELDLLNSTQFIEYLNDTQPGLGEQFDPSIDNDWQDAVLREAPIASVNLSASGGSEKTKYYVSGAFFDQEGIVLGTDYQRINGRVNLDQEINDKLSFGIKTGITFSTNNRVPGDQSINGVLPNAISKPPIYRIRDENGNFLEEGFWDNPVAVGEEATNIATTFRNISNFNWEYRIIPGLTFKNQWGYDNYQLEERRYEPTTTDRGAESNGIAISATSGVQRITQVSSLNYDFSPIDKLEVSALAGYSFEIERERSNFIRAINFPSDELEYIASAGTIEEASSSASDFGINSFFGRAKFIYDQKYIITVNFRRDGSTNFGENFKYGNFPGLSAAWRLGDESFFPESRILSDVKLRVGYGLAGNDQIGSFRFLNTYSAGFNYRQNPGIVPSRIPNPDLKWEQTAQLNAGIDFGFFEDRLGVQVDYYLNKTSDLLLNRPLPGSTGFSSVSANVGRMENEGLELAVNGLVLDGPLKWNVNFNISGNRNTVTELFGDQPILDVGRGGNSVIVGQPLGSFFLLKSLGVDPSTGDLVFEDVNNDNQVSEGADRQVVGNPAPDFYGGFTNNLSFKGFDLTVLFQFNYGNEIYNGVRQYAENMTFGENDNQLTSVLLRWQQPGDIAPVPRINGTFNNDITSHYIEDGSFLRLKTVTLGYMLPREISSKAGFSKARVYVTMQNFWLLTAYTGYDPEVNYAGIDPIRAGTDFFTFPQPKSILGGINLKF